MKALWLKYAQQFDRLSLRERLMVFGATLLVVLYLIFAIFIDPAQTRQRVLTLQMQSQREEIALFERQRAKPGSPAADADAAVHARREALTRRIEETDQALRALEKNLVPAQRMNLVLQEVLRAEPGVQLVHLRTLPVVPLLPEAQQKPAPAAAPASAPAAKTGRRDFVEGNVYKHGVEITVRGTYVDLYNYLARLERSQWQMFWSRARLTTEQRPRLTMTVTLYTLSLDKAWLEV
ncbi:MAG TPA: type II secretion system protein GspM [Burkholderiales bacterium]|nr:type II secretion system protein GspM [Burkholderiales bacterium]